jgi:rhodanese-related sulfurtransferase
MTTIDDVLADARGRIRRLDPNEALAAVTGGALLVDIRPAAQREDRGGFPNALVIERNVLEWRLDPASEARLPQATDHDVEFIIACEEGFTSSLAAASLVDLGLRRVTDLEGGHRAWREAGLPVVAVNHDCPDTSRP